jgi:DNA polymerase-1
MPRAFLLDGTALAYRSHFALVRSGLSTPDGQPCGATYGFTMTLRKILEEERPDRIAVAFDPPGATFRHALYDDYKATRQKAPDEMVAQLEWLREIVRAHGVPLFEVPGFEADDVIGTLARQAERAGWEVLIVTGDKDFMQLVGPRVKLYNVFKPNQDLVVEDERAVLEKFHTTPEHVIDVLAIMGDASDNVPGVKGIGEKGAVKLIEEFGSVAALVEGLERVKGKTREKIEQSLDRLRLSLALVTIDTEVPLDPGFEALAPPAPDVPRLVAVLQELGFVSLLRRVEVAPSPAERRDYHLVRDRAGLESMLAELRAAGEFAFDTETDSLFPMQSELVGLSFSAAPMRAFYVPFNLDPPVLPGGKRELLEVLAPLLTDPSLRRIGQNYKYDALVLAAQGVCMPAPDFDTMVASFCVAGTSRRHNLDDLALTYFDLRKIPTSDLIGRGAKQVTMAEVAVEKVAEYACEDADVTFRLRAALAPELERTGSEALFRELEMPLVPVLTRMEERGIRLDVALLASIGAELERDLARVCEEIYGLAGETFNLNSPKALGEVLFERLCIHEVAGIRRPRRTQTGWATDFDTLTSSYGDVEIVKKLLEYREAAKLKSTYVEALPRFVNPRTGRVHCSFSQVSAATGRLASSDPNLQNIPVRSERGRALRQAFVAREGDGRGEWALLTADYSQVELRILAHFSGDERMRAAFAQGRDIHASTASIVFDVPEPAVTREMRSRAKAVNFGLLYGMGAPRLARETGLSILEARQFIERYFASFPTVRGWRDALLERARETGSVETILGRRRPLPDIRSEDARARAAAENMAVNTPIQGSAADIIKRAMIDLDRRLAERGLSAGLLLQVHDELVLEVPLGELEETSALVRECMEHAVTLSVPLKVDLGHGRTWLEAH